MNVSDSGVMEKPRDRRPEALGNLQQLPDETLCRIIGLLAPKDVGSLACVSSIFYIFCNEEPLWMALCLESPEGLLSYKGSWKLTALEKSGLVKGGTTVLDKAPLQFDGFSSMFLYRRWYRCHMALEGFLIPGTVERKEKLSEEEFHSSYDGKKPVLVTDLAEGWPAKDSWAMSQLVERYGDVAFKVGQSKEKTVMMSMRSYAAYMRQQHDEEPLYIFDDKFGKHAPTLLQDYQVPCLFSEDLLALLGERRPPFRWLVIGPCRSGASWHVDPALTSAWNTLLSGRKRWALYPPGRVPPAVMVHVDEEDGDVDFDGPTSLQWWMDIYPALREEEKPIECIQLPGETIYVPSGWWHCVLNIESSVAVTQNFVNGANFELVCLDMAPGFRHRGIARAGNMALNGNSWSPKEDAIPADLLESSNGKHEHLDKGNDKLSWEVVADSCRPQSRVVSNNELDHPFFEFDALSAHIETHPDHFCSKSSSNYLGQRLLREWLRKLWTARHDLQPRIWKILDAQTWLHRVVSICDAYGFPVPEGVEQLPVGNGSNPVFLVGKKVIKLYVEDGDPQVSVDTLGSELEFYAQIRQDGSALESVVPALVGSGIVYSDGNDFTVVPWDGTGEIPVASAHGEGVNFARKRGRDSEREGRRIRTKWSRSRSVISEGHEAVGGKDLICPYIVTECCDGVNLAQIGKELATDDMMALATFLGQQLRNLHSLALPRGLVGGGYEAPRPGIDEEMPKHVKQGEKHPRNGDAVFGADEREDDDDAMASVLKPESKWSCVVPWEWRNFVTLLRQKREHILERVEEWGTIPDHLIEKIDSYLPKDPVTSIDFLKVTDNVAESLQPPVWLHMDVMNDNVQMSAPAADEPLLEGNARQPANVLAKTKATHIIDFGDIDFGDGLYDFVAIYLDIFRGDTTLMKQFLHSYKLPVWWLQQAGHGLPRPRLSYKAMCYVLLYRITAGKVLFQVKEVLQKAESWEEVEEKVWGFLNDWQKEMEEGSACAAHEQCD